MAELNDAQKREIVELLACFTTPAEIIAYFRREYEEELTHKQVGRYDPTKLYYEGGDRWREVFEVKRKAYIEQVAEVPVANQGYRLRLLQKGIEAAEKAKNWPLVASLAEQAAKEVGGVLTNERNVRVDDNRGNAANLTPDERRMALADLIRQAMEAAPARLAPPIIEGDAKEVAA